MMKRIKSERGAALLEAAITLPMLLLVAVGIFEFGRAYQTWQVLTNAAREGSRVAVIFGTTKTQIEDAVIAYAGIGGIPECGTTSGKVTCIQRSFIDVNQNFAVGERTASRVEIALPFNFMVLNGIAKMFNKSSSLGTPLTMHAVSLMRNEGA